MGRSTGLYGPFIVVVLVQALVIAIAPSPPATQPTVGGAAPGGPGAPATGESAPDAGSRPAPGGQDGSGAADSSEAGVAIPDPGAGASGSGGAGSGGPGEAPGGGAGEGNGATGDQGGGDGGSQPGQPRASQGDTSHCTEDGRQHDIVPHAPPCVPAWPDGGDNGGATYQGVTEDTITVVYFREDKNPQVTAILNAEGLRATREQEVAFMEAAEDFLNEHYEFYGRELDLVIYDAEECPETPPDVQACREEVRRMVAQHEPLIAYWPVPTYPRVFDEFVRHGVIALGGWHFDDSYYAERRPYRYDAFMDGTRTAELIAEYYCTKLAGEPATNAGPVIHPSYPNGGSRDLVPRRLGILTQDTEANRLPAEHLQRLVAECDDRPPVLATYESNIDTGAAQSEGNTPKFLEAEVTTLVCMCDPITPVFRTNENDRNNWYPEYLMSGAGLLDFDKLGRLYNPQSQWLHAFGPSHLANPHATDEQDQSVVWQDQGGSGNPCGGPCGLFWVYQSLVGTMIQMAGPDLTPATIEQGTLSLPPSGGWQQTGGDPHVTLVEFGQGDYTALSDAREVYWSNDRTSRIDGRPGSYAPMNGGRRYRLGEIPAGFDVPAKQR